MYGWQVAVLLPLSANGKPTGISMVASNEMIGASEMGFKRLVVPRQSLSVSSCVFERLAFQSYDFNLVTFFTLLFLPTGLPRSPQGGRPDQEACLSRCG